MSNDIDRTTQASMPITITNEAEDKQVDVVQVAGVNRLATDSNISSINVPLGKDPLPDTYFTILTAGSAGDTITIDIAATANDSTTPDDDYPSYSYTYTLIAADVGDEKVLAKNL